MLDYSTSMVDSAVWLILGRGSSEWGVPGGGQEDYETMEATARRETMGRAGITTSLTSINHLRHEIATCEGHGDRFHVLRVFFHADSQDGSIATRAGEANGAARFANPQVKLGCFHLRSDYLRTGTLTENRLVPGLEHQATLHTPSEVSTRFLSDTG